MTSGSSRDSFPKLKRLDCIEEVDRFGRYALFLHKLLSEGRDLWDNFTDQAGRRLDSGKHSGGAKHRRHDLPIAVQSNRKQILSNSKRSCSREKITRYRRNRCGTCRLPGRRNIVFVIRFEHHGQRVHSAMRASEHCSWGSGMEAKRGGLELYSADVHRRNRWSRRWNGTDSNGSQLITARAAILWESVRETR